MNPKPKSLDERISDEVQKKKLTEVRAIDSANTYTKDAKVEQVQSYLTKANEIMAVLTTEVSSAKTIEELIAKKDAIRILNNDLREALYGSFDSIIYNY